MVFYKVQLEQKKDGVLSLTGEVPRTKRQVLG